MKGLALAAGLGTRLRPLTLDLPKPLTLFMGEPILELVIKQLKAASIQKLAVNTHYLPEVITHHLRTSPVTASLDLHISHEPEILGTGGCLNPLRDWLGSSPLLIFNGDIVSDVDLSAFRAAFELDRPVASMVVLPHKAGTTPVYVRGDRVVGIGGQAPQAGDEARTFAGIHVLSPEFIAAVPPTAFQTVIDTYQIFLAQGARIGAFHHDGFWADLGIPRDYLEAHNALKTHPGRDALVRRLQLDTNGWLWHTASDSFYRHAKPIAGVRSSYVFGPVEDKGPANLEQCIVYPLSRLNVQAKGLLIKGDITLNMLG